MAGRLRLGATGGQIEISISQTTPAAAAANYLNVFVNDEGKLAGIGSTGAIIVYGEQFSGTSGTSGSSGTSGTSGSSGSSGTSGSSGSSGTSGSSGSSGTSGSSGSSGTSGSSGSSGTSGSSGSSGTSGSSGSSGTSGSSGINGPTGADGSSGLAGPTGPTGADGSSGQSGVTGPTGPGAILLTNQILATGGWSLVGNYYQNTYLNANITPTSIVNFTPYNDSVYASQISRVYPYVEAFGGSANFFALYPPNSSIIGDVTIITTI